jgi:ribosomal protein L24E
VRDEAIPMHSMDARKCSVISDQLSQGKGRGQLFVKCDRARSGFFFFRSKERGEIKSDCNHW